MHQAAIASAQRFQALLEEFVRSGLDSVVQAAEAIARAFTTGNKLLVFGNGGSAAQGQHLAAELVNRYRLERPSLPALALTTDTSVLTSVANDYKYDQVFVRQINGLGLEGDVALGISTSGRSPNVLLGLGAARRRGLTTIGLTGMEVEDIAGLCDLLIRVPSDETPRVQEVHLVVLHQICEMVDLALFGRSQ